MQRLAATGARELRFWRPGGAPIERLEPLRGQPLLGLSITANRPLDDADWRLIESFGELRYLAITQESVTGTLHVDRLPDLSWLGTPWWRGLTGLQEHPLRGLGLSKWRPTGPPFAALPGTLQALTLTQSGLQDLRGCEALAELGFLGLYHVRGLRTLAGIEGLPALRELIVAKAPNLEAAAGLADCARLERVKFADCRKLGDLDLRASASLRGLWLEDRLGSTVDWIDAAPDLTHVKVARSISPRADQLERDCGDPFFGPPPSYAFRPPTIWEYATLARFRNPHLHPEWLRREHPELCVG